MDERSATKVLLTLGYLPLETLNWAAHLASAVSNPGAAYNSHRPGVRSFRYAHDVSPLAGLTRLGRLKPGGDWISPRIAHIDSIAWLPSLNNLEHLVLHTLIVDHLAYAPLLDLPKLLAVRGMESPGMHPSYEEPQDPTAVERVTHRGASGHAAGRMHTVVPMSAGVDLACEQATDNRGAIEGPCASPPVPCELGTTVPD